jgi:hypothetical protein
VKREEPHLRSPCAHLPCMLLTLVSGARCTRGNADNGAIEVELRAVVVPATQRQVCCLTPSYFTQVKMDMTRLSSRVA